MEANSSSLRIAPDAFDGKSRHICAFFNSIDEQHRVLRSFVAKGFADGERAFHLIDPALRDDHLSWLVDAGIDVEAASASGQLEVHPWDDGPLHGERFDQDAWLVGFEQVLQAGPASGYVRTRVLAQMEWALVDMPGIDEMMEFETRVNTVVPRYDDVVVCTYDLSRFPASMVMFALRTHPLVIIGGLLHENPFYVDPDELLRELRARRAAVT
jgi:hypothetical protein